MLSVIILAAAITLPTKFDLMCEGQNKFIGFKAQIPIPYEERFSIDLTAGLYSDSDHVTPEKIAEIADQIIWLERDIEQKGKAAVSYLAVNRFDGSVMGEVDYGDGHKIELKAECKVVPFSRWDHRVF